MGRFAYKVVHMIVGRIRFLAVFWLEVSSVLGMGASPSEPLKWAPDSSEQAARIGKKKSAKWKSHHSFCNLISEAYPIALAVFCSLDVSH